MLASARLVRAYNTWPRRWSFSRLFATAVPSSKSASHMSGDAPKKEGNIADAFTSLSGGNYPSLPDSYRQLKLALVDGHENKVVASWENLLSELKRENQIIVGKGSAVIPQVKYADLESDVERVKDEIRLRGVVIVRGVIPQDEARAYKEEVEVYVKRNPWTKAFPPDNPQVYELYWSPSQLEARAHPNLLHVQRHLMTSLWHVSSPSAPISMSQPLAYADRLRIRQPGDATFALGPHMDGGSVERWESEGYGRGGVYDRIFAGDYGTYDPWDSTGRIYAVSNNHNGLGPCSMFRMWQGWLSMSHSGPHEGTLLVNPLMRLATVYLLLRPFFRARDADLDGTGLGYLDAANWEFLGHEGMTSELQGAMMGYGQEVTDELHPHLELHQTLVHVPEVKPGDFVAWHCDTIHAVDKVHRGTADSSVLYIPICPVTPLNAKYLARQRAAFREGLPGPDFPGGEGEARHKGRWTEATLRARACREARRAMGLESLVAADEDSLGAREAVRMTNAILGF